MNIVNISYLFGAGASAEALPIVNQIPQRIENLISLMESDDYKLADNEFYTQCNFEQYSKRQIQGWFVDDLKWLLDKTKNHASIDTFAKKLFITFQDGELNRLKNSFSVFLILEQAINKTDIRYDSFFASILKNAYYALPQNIKIISWNYDYQFEKAYSEYSRQKSLSENQQLLNVFNKYATNPNIDDNKDRFTIIKLNGSSNLIESNWHRLHFFNDDITAELSIDLISNILKNYAFLRLKDGNIYSGLSFAWESFNSNYQINVVEHTKNVTQNTDILIVIGYSFPYFNREIDREIIGNMNNLRKVYFQSPEAENIKERFLSIRNDLKDNQLLVRKDCGQFLLPNEL